MTKLLRLAVLAMALLGSLSAPAGAQGLIRDAEIERTLRNLSAPVFEAAGLEPDSVSIFIVNDPELNAFVAGGMNMFLNTGLLMRTDTPEQVLGVIAHETGHIAGGHLSRTGDAFQQAAATQILSALLGAGAAVLGAPQVGTAVIAGGATVAERGFLKFSRSQEQSADQAALAYLDDVEVTSQGLLEFFGTLESQRFLSGSRQDAYLRTHPLTRDRIRLIEAHLRRSPYKDAMLNEAVRADHERMVAKLVGFLQDPHVVLQDIRGEDNPSIYARAVATYRLPDMDSALGMVDQLIEQKPDDPYYHELRGQILFENGRIEPARQAYAKALDLAPYEPLIRFGLARCLMERGQRGDMAEAAVHLEEVVQEEPRNAQAWRQLGIAYGRTGEEGPSQLALAESAFITGQFDDARLYLNRADANLPQKGPQRLRLLDLQAALEAL
ncbi:MAG: M48 family metalloprotease [Geminicoccaceae bacterium]